MSNDNQDEIITKNPLKTPPPAPKKSKDPKKVAAGKRLAEYNRKAKEKNRLEKDENESWFPETSLITIIALLGLGLTALDLFLGYKKSESPPTATVSPQLSHQPPPPSPSPPSSFNLAALPSRKMGMG